MTAAYRLYAPDVIDHQPAPGQRAGIDGIVDVLGWLREAVPDLQMEIAQYVVEDDLAADRWIMRGTHTGAPLMGIEAHGRPFEINGMDVIRIRDDGLISDVWHVEEFAQLRAQIGG
jgi:predicted ester cyclase